MKVKVNDKVLVISGKEKGKTGRVMRVITKSARIVVEKLNMRTKHIKKSAQRAGEKIHFEAPFHSSNVMIICPSCQKSTRAGYKTLENGKKERICKKCNQSLAVSATAENTTKTKKITKKIKAV